MIAAAEAKHKKSQKVIVGRGKDVCASCGPCAPCWSEKF